MLQDVQFGKVWDCGDQAQDEKASHVEEAVDGDGREGAEGASWLARSLSSMEEMLMES